MTNFKMLFLIFISALCSCTSKKNEQTNKNNQLDSSSSNTTITMNTNKSQVIYHSDPTLDDIIKAAEGQIKFYKTATKEELIAFLGISAERMKTVSDEEFNDLVREENAYMYENLIDELQQGKTEFQVISNENNLVKISFNEKGNNGFAMVMNFEYIENGMLVAQQKTRN